MQSQLRRIWPDEAGEAFQVAAHDFGAEALNLLVVGGGQALDALHVDAAGAWKHIARLLGIVRQADDNTSNSGETITSP